MFLFFQGTSPAVKLKLKKPKNDRKVKWEQGTVDNEHMDKKKSKCKSVHQVTYCRYRTVFCDSKQAF